MRNFAILLLLLNLAYLGWNLGSYSESNDYSVETSRPAQVTVATGTLLLLSEAQAVVELSSQSIATPASSLICLAIGSFASLEESENIALNLEALGYSAEIVLLEVAANPDFWVHMPPFGSMAAARERLAELQESNIDSYIISTSEAGDLAQGISLGLFGESSRALFLQTQLAAQGFPSSIYEVARKNEEFWIDIIGLNEADSATIMTLEIINGQTELNLQEKLCETIAQEL